MVETGNPLVVGHEPCPLWPAQWEVETEQAGDDSMSPVRPDGERRPQRHAAAVDRGNDTADTSVLDNDVADMSALTHHYPRVPRTIEEEGVEPEAREPDRPAPWCDSPEIGEKTTSPRRMDEHALHAMSAKVIEVALEPEVD
jgi:hypothetical protein